MTRFSIVKLSCIFALSLLTVSGCKKAEEPPLTTVAGAPHGPNNKVDMEGGPSGMVMKFTYTQQDIDSLLKLPAVSRPEDARSAAQYLLGAPLRMPLGAHFLPTKNITLMEQTDTTAQFSADVVQGPLSIVVNLAKRKSGNESIWVVTKMAEFGRKM